MTFEGKLQEPYQSLLEEKIRRKNKKIFVLTLITIFLLGFGILNFYKISFLSLNIETLVGIIAILLTIGAYFQTERKKFLLINIFAVFFFGLSLILKGGFIGGITAFVSTLVYLSALICKDQVQNILKFVVPISSFGLYFLISDNPENILPIFGQLLIFVSLFVPLGSSIITFGAYQKNMIYNKILLIIGLSFWALYALAIQSYYALVTDLIGIIVVIYSLYLIKNKKGKK